VVSVAGKTREVGAKKASASDPRFYKSMLYPVFRHLNEILVRWAVRRYKRLRRHKNRARRFIADVARRQTPARHCRALAAGRAPRRLDDGIPVSRDVHAGFCERRG